jgi:hypothetical protein
MVLVEGKAAFPRAGRGALKFTGKRRILKPQTNLSFGFAALRSNTEK